MNNSTLNTDFAANENSLLRRVEIFLEDGEFDRADEYCEKVLDMNVENGTAYFYKLLAKLRLNSKDQLTDVRKPFDDLPEYSKIMRFGSTEQKNEVSSLNAAIVSEIEEKRKQTFYDRAVSLMDSTDITTLTEAYSIFKNLGEFGNSKELLSGCEEKIERIYDAEYNEIYAFVKDREQEINSRRYQSSADLAERDNYDQYIQENRSKKFFDFSFLITLSIAIIGLIIIVLTSNSYLTLAGISFKTVLRCIFTRILPGIPLTIFSCVISYTLSKKFVRKQKENLIADIGTAAERAMEIGNKINSSESEALYLQKELDESLDALRKLNSEYDAFTSQKDSQ